MFARRRHNEMIMKLCFAAMWSKRGYNVSPRPAVCSSISVQSSGLLAGSIERHTLPFTLFFFQQNSEDKVALSETSFSLFSSHLNSFCVWLLSLFLLFFQVLSTWRLYFLPPKIPAKVFFFLAHLLWLCRMSRFLRLRRLNSPLSNVSMTTGGNHV